ncbi:beta-ketoacyl synthase N-terminal-like domain-containing protein [Streptomyces sp. NPDC051963]|uniref:beta-ketoacyl [acyl carrier protein] synthase domain-containing protein n=1 Tax=Streptomyces sp. NPDC051963 TaxID=3365678 RepID=UPI0037D7EF68
MNPEPQVPEPIAVIGMSCRTAGADDAEALWQLLRGERRLIGPVPEQRVPAVDAGPVEAQPLQAALLDDATGFDAAFFGISRRMAAWMDPHQRMLLELTWHALENAAIAPERLRGSPVAVFAAAPMADYRERMIQADVVDSAAFPGTLITFTANQISYQFDWTGPSYAIDSACSSGLSVLAPAVQGLRGGEFSLAAVMAANITCNGFYTSSAYQAGALSPTGESVPFSTRRDGYNRGEGGACLLLKRLADAERDGDPVHAVIRGIGVAHNGRAGGLTGSDAPAQTQLFLRTARTAGIPLSSVGYIEAHGTGTGGDLAEATAVTDALRTTLATPRTQAAGPDGKMWIGSIKSNIGHLEAAAGLLGVVKAVLILRHGLIPPIAGLNRPDPDLPFGDMPVALADHPVTWPRGAAVRRIGVNSFGVGGALAHAVIEDAPEVTPGTTAATCSAPMAVPLSAMNRAGLSALATRLLRTLGGPQPPDLNSLAWTAQTGRATLRERRVLVAADLAELTGALAAVAAEQTHEHVVDADHKGALGPLPADMAHTAGDWLDGLSVDWAKHWPDPQPSCPDLPGYPFQRRAHWFDANGPAPRTPTTAPHAVTH